MPSSNFTMALMKLNIGYQMLPKPGTLCSNAPLVELNEEYDGVIPVNPGAHYYRYDSANGGDYVVTLVSTSGTGTLGPGFRYLKVYKGTSCQTFVGLAGYNGSIDAPGAVEVSATAGETIKILLESQEDFDLGGTGTFEYTFKIEEF